MSIKLKLAALVKFAVKGTYNDENGAAQSFSFSLVCDRLTGDELIKSFADGVKLSEAFARITKDWSDVHDEKGAPIPYTAQGLEQLFSIPGLPHLTYMTYLSESGAKAKN